MPEVAGKEVSAEIPEDVAALYAWADLKGLKYHDFSLARRAFRAQLHERGDARGLDALSAPGRPAQAGFAVTLAGPESMLPQRFPRRRSARELAPSSPETGEPTIEVPVTETERASEDADAVAQLLIAAENNGAGGGQGAGAKANSGARETPAGASPAVPAWIYGEVTGGDGSVALSSSVLLDSGAEASGARSQSVMDTLQHSRERVASRWFALRGVFDPAAPAMEPTQAHAREVSSPVLAVISLAGGVGKTSLTAAVGRALSALGERVLLADITAQGLLPFYFGSKQLRPGIVRKFLPPPGSSEVPICVVSYEVARQQDISEHSVPAELVENEEEFDRIVVDLSPVAGAVAKALLHRRATMLVPVTPDMNSVIGLGAMERFFAKLGEDAGTTVLARYLLTQFDPALPLHLDVREVIRRQLGDRLLPFVIRRSPAVAEALAEGMTVIDYAPESGVADDYRELAKWVRSCAAPAQGVPNSARWSER